MGADSQRHYRSSNRPTWRVRNHADEEELNRSPHSLLVGQSFLRARQFRLVCQIDSRESFKLVAAHFPHLVGVIFSSSW